MRENFISETLNWPIYNRRFYMSQFHFQKFHIYENENDRHVVCEKPLCVIIVHILSFYFECFSLSDEISTEYPKT